MLHSSLLKGSVSMGITMTTWKVELLWSGVPADPVQNDLEQIVEKAESSCVVLGKPTFKIKTF